MTMNSDDPLIGKTISGKYEVVQLIGEGGMARVYMAIQKNLERFHGNSFLSIRFFLFSQDQLL